MKYSVSFTKQAKEEIKRGKIYYNNQQKGLGTRFYETVIAQAKLLYTSPYFALRYANIHCLPVKGFPFMLHYIIDEQKKQVKIYGVIHTSQNPDKHWLLHQ